DRPPSRFSPLCFLLFHRVQPFVIDLDRLALAVALEPDVAGDGLNAVRFPVADFQDWAVDVVFHGEIPDMEVACRATGRIETLDVKRREEAPRTQRAAAEDRIFQLDPHAI